MPLSWIPLTSEAEVDQIIERSTETPCVIFKHSTRCSISTAARMRLEAHWPFDETELPAYFLDLIAFRPVSKYVAEVFQVHHESPQILLINQGECIYDTSHLDITVQELQEQVEAISRKHE